VGQAESGVNYDFNELLPPTQPQPTPPKQPTPPHLSKFFFLGSTFRGF